MKPYVKVLTEAVDAAYGELSAISDQQSAARPASGGWSAREIIGHLIDSAAVNHQRFVRGAFQDDMVFAPYEQDDWVAVQRYQDAPWDELLHLWQGYNRHLARVMAAIPVEARQKKHTKHNFHEVAWKPLPEGVATTLDYLMEDYVDHLNHHLRQVLAGRR